MRINLLPLCLFAALLAPPLAAQAEPAKGAPKLLGTYGLWKAYSYEDKDQPVCYMALAAHFAEDKKFKNRIAYLTITHRPAENTKDVVSYAAGYNFKPTSDMDVTVGKKTFNLFTMKDTAWSRDAATDHAFANAIRNSASLKIIGTPVGKSATPVTDTIPLKGATAAYGAIGKACGYPADAAPAKPQKPASKKTPAKKS